MEHAEYQTTHATPVKFEAEESKYRLLQENFITPEECRMLVELVETYGEVGDGYHGNPHPHTPTEIFGGYSFEGFRHSKPRMVPGHREALRIMLRARKLIKKHFGLPFLWLDYGHLVFREPVPEAVGSTEEEFSHPWHFDNQSEGVKHRTHTAILYLNDEFTGGLTRFQETDYMPFRELQPEPGKLVAFDVSANAHGVSKLTSGRRYVLNMWFSTHWRMLTHHYRIFRAL
jgi:hypothetical protein